MKALILAAGYATRLYPLTKDSPKPLLEIEGKAILDRLLEKFSKIRELDHIYVITNDKFYPHFLAWRASAKNKKRYSDFDISIINDGTQSNETRLGAIADIHFAVSQYNISDDLIIAAGDNIYTFNFYRMYDFFCQKGADVILTYRVQESEKLHRSGVVEIDQENRVIEFEEKPTRPKSNLACPALYIFQKETLSLFEKYLKTGKSPDAPGNFISWLCQLVPVYAFIMDAKYYDIGTLQAYQNAQKELKHPGDPIKCE